MKFRHFPIALLCEDCQLVAELALQCKPCPQTAAATAQAAAGDLRAHGLVRPEDVEIVDRDTTRSVYLGSLRAQTSPVDGYHRCFLQAPYGNAKGNSMYKEYFIKMINQIYHT